MSFDYAASAASARRLIEKFGASWTISRAYDDHDPITGIVDTAAPFAGPIAMVLLPVKGKSVEGMDDQLAYGLARDSQKMGIAAADGAPFEPRAADIVSLDNDRWEVLSCFTLNPSGTSPVIHYLGLKQA